MEHPGSVSWPRETVPSAIGGASKVEGLGRPSRTALLVAALAEECDQWALVGATSIVLGGPVDLDVLDVLAARGLVAVESSRVRIPHDDVRRAVTARALPSERQAVHRALATVLRDDSLDAAWHRTHSRQACDAEAAAMALTTARRLQQMGRPGHAREMLEQAARLSTTMAARAACLLEAAATTFALGLVGEAEDLLERADRAGLSADLQRLSRLLRATITEPTLRSLEESPGEAARAARTLHNWGLACMSFSVLLRATGQSVTPEPVTATTQGGATQETATQETATHGAAALQALVALRSGELPEAARLLAEECPRLARAGLRGVETHARAVLAQTAARVGDLGTATSEAARARELAWETRQPAWATHAAVTEATVASMRGEPDAVRKVEDIRRTVLVGENPLGPLVELAHAVVLLGADEWWDAYPVLVRLTSRAAHTPELTAELLTAGLLGYLAEAALHTDQVPAGWDLVSRIAAASPACASGAALVDLLYATAVLAPDDRSTACFQILLALDTGRWPWVRARGDLAYGASLRRRRLVSQARPHLLSAQGLFAALDAAVWQRRVHTELRAAGVRAGTTPPAVQEEIAGKLSPQETEIVRLAAQGLSNRQIGDRLFLSPRTVGSHLYRIFPKLDVTSRHQLVGLVS